MTVCGFHSRRALASAVLLFVLFIAVAVGAQETPPLRVAVIDVGRLLEESDAGKAALQELRSLQESKQAEAQAIQDEIAALRGQINEGRLSLAEERLAQLQQQLEDKMIEGRRFQDDFARELQQRQEQMFESVQAQVMPIINAVGQERGIDLIFNKYESGLVFAMDRVDITESILERFNAASPPEEAAGENAQ